MRPQVRLAKRILDTAPLPYTASPLKLLLEDFSLAFRYAWALPLVFFPLRIGQTSRLDELDPTFQSAMSLSLQMALSVSQILFLLSIPSLVILMIPALLILLYAVFNLAANYAICMFFLNGFGRVLVSQAPVSEQPGHERECWFFINGVATGSYWLQKDLDQLSHTFGRKITGIQNRTAGLIFDVIECLIQRCFSYATTDVRLAYTSIKEALLSPDCDKVVLILHSQGGIEGGLVIDWLLDELPQDLLHQLEVYTFGNAANHFNNPRRTRYVDSDSSHTLNCLLPATGSVGNIEHYVNSHDPVAWLGVLTFVNLPNLYRGRLFVRPGSGHMLNQHYLDPMFTLGPDKKVLESNPFMDTEVNTKMEEMDGRRAGIVEKSNEHSEETLLPIENQPHQEASQQHGCHQVLRIKDFSRLWQYRNGGFPEIQI
ncbi:uncharacterized protein N7459_007734 [Penicillium hispanicum]|uniref:uncharacterized protein n=1 Tax=Penicillium hispanicum TaxID=1080232 RepID=UPI00253F91BC|nr:uncharacterized protein N7459_007734 [Penicillium hispanicum]KAJ5578770.1 hypothetical protein N7459_007734 [Penicillium hispanicum]